jgi:hypothetical protein
MSGGWTSALPDRLTRAARAITGRRSAAEASTADAVSSAAERQRRLERVRFHLGRGRRAREAGRFEDGAREARRALALNPHDPWSLALLGQCLARQQAPDRGTARRALERARALDPTNGYFVRLLLEVLEIQGDARARGDVLAWAWWSGAPVDRWLPGGPPRPWIQARAAATDGGPAVPPPGASASAGERRPGSSGTAPDRQPLRA